jgi:hypothetical protein
VTAPNPQVVLACALALAACIPGSDGASDPPAITPPRACTEIGCASGLSVDFVRSGRWAAGNYRIEVTADGNAGACEITLPLSCSRQPRCTGASAWRVGESGCALDPQSHSLTGVDFSPAQPVDVTVTVSLDDRRLGEARLQPVYTTSQPNGPGCEPVCRQARATLTLAP